MYVFIFKILWPSHKSLSFLRPPRTKKFDKLGLEYLTGYKRLPCSNGLELDLQFEIAKPVKEPSGR